MGNIGSMEQFRERYLPVSAIVRKAAVMNKPAFQKWYMQLPEEMQTKVREGLQQLAKNHRAKSQRILNLLGY